MNESSALLLQSENERLLMDNFFAYRKTGEK